MKIYRDKIGQFTEIQALVQSAPNDMGKMKTGWMPLATSSDESDPAGRQAWAENVRDVLLLLLEEKEHGVIYMVDIVAFVNTNPGYGFAMARVSSTKAASTLTATYGEPVSTVFDFLKVRTDKGRNPE